MSKKRKSDLICESDPKIKHNSQSAMVTRTQKKKIEAIDRENFIVAIYIPDSDISEESDFDESCDESDGNDDSEDSNSDSEIDSFLCYESYEKVLSNYSIAQKKLESGYVYTWEQGEYPSNKILTNEILLSEKDKKQLASLTFTELFELFFSSDLKEYIISYTIANGCDISLDKLETFIGIVIFSIFNRRLSQRDYWSTDPLLESEKVKSAMSRNEFEKIKSFLKYSTPNDQNDNDKVWRVRKILNIFRKNIRQFGFLLTALSIDETMIKYFGRNSLKQFIKSKPIRFGIKMWALCSAEGYLFDCDIYCGKKSTSGDFLPNCAQGSRVVLQMLQHLLIETSKRKLPQYHIYFDNLFTSPDLLVHMKKIGLRATGTVGSDRVSEKNEVDKKAAKGVVKHEKGSKMNFITVVDSKPVSILSTDVTPLSTVNRYNKTEKKKTNLQYPNAFTYYNKFMGGVDVHDQHCNRLLPIVRSKKWTWVVFIRLIQSFITNATVLYNICNNDDRKVG